MYVLNVIICVILFIKYSYLYTYIICVIYKYNSAVQKVKNLTPGCARHTLKTISCDIVPIPNSFNFSKAYQSAFNNFTIHSHLISASPQDQIYSNVCVALPRICPKTYLLICRRILAILL